MTPKIRSNEILLSSDFFPEIGGAHSWVYEVYRRWPEPVIGFVHDYFSVSAMKQLQDDFDNRSHGSLMLWRLKLKYDNINLMNPDFWKYLLIIARYIKSVSASKRVNLHCLRAFPDGLPCLLFKWTNPSRYNLVTYAHGEEILVARTSQQLKWIAKMIYRNSNLIIANSQFTERLIRNLCPEVRVTVIHPGVDLKAFNVPNERKLAQRIEWGWPADIVVLTTVARMEPRKNHVAVLRALSGLQSEGCPLAYVIGGMGDYQPRLEALVQKLGLTRWVRFTGRLSDEERVLTLASADIHVMPSIQAGSMIEGFGIVFLEAAAAGIPSVCGNVGGQPEAVINEVTGYVVDGESLEEVKSAIKNLTLNAELRQNMGNEGRKWAAQNDWQKVVEKIYEAVILMEKNK